MNFVNELRHEFKHRPAQRKGRLRVCTHDLTDPANVYVAPGGRRFCRACRLANKRRYRTSHCDDSGRLERDRTYAAEWGASHPGYRARRRREMRQSRRALKTMESAWG